MTLRSVLSGMVLVAVLAAGSAAQAAPVKPCDLMKMLMSSHAATVQKGVQGFVDMGEMAATPLVCFVAGKAAGAPTPTAQGKTNGERALIKLGSQAVPAILERLRGGSEETRMRLVRVLAQIPDSRRAAPLMELWKTEKADQVRAALVGAVVSLKGSQAVLLLRSRIASAGLAERVPLAAQLALRGTLADLQKLLARVPSANVPAFLTQVALQVRAIGGPAVGEAIQRIKSLASAR